MKGLELSEAYFVQLGLPMIEKKFSEYKHRIAAGLVGEGSECYGFDDQISIDHDWGAAFCLWLEPGDYHQIGADLQDAYDELPKTFLGFQAKNENPMAQGRIGVLSIPSFYQGLLGLDHVPVTLEQWRAIPEHGLSAATNGRIFCDPLGQFTSFRNGLKAYYPEDIRLKKIAARCMTMAQTGQYNYLRCVRHGEMLTAQIALSMFAEAAISMVFLLNKEYKPFYKWMHRAMKGLPVLGESGYQLLQKFTVNYQLPEEEMVRNNISLIEEVCSLVIEELRRQELSTCSSDFLFDHGPYVQRQIQNQWLRSQNVMSD